MSEIAVICDGAVLDRSLPASDSLRERAQQGAGLSLPESCRVEKPHPGGNEPR